jgi:hypothetical protein
LSDDDLDRLWSDLADRQGVKAFQAMRTLFAHPQEAVELCRKRLPPVASPDPKMLARLLADLDSKNFAIRDKATEALAKLGPLAEPALRTELKENLPAEVRNRIRELLARLAKEKAQFRLPNPEQLLVLRVVELIERLPGLDAHRLLQTWSRGAPEALLTQEAKTALRRREQGFL